MDGFRSLMILVAVLAVLGIANANGNWTMGVNDELTSRLVVESITERILDDDLKALLILKANRLKKTYRYGGFTFESCVRIDTPQTAAWCRCVSDKLASLPAVGLRSSMYSDDIIVAFDECKASTLDGTEANIGALCEGTRLALSRGISETTGTFCDTSCPDSADLEDCSDECVRDLMPGFCSSGGPPALSPMENCLVNLASWKQSFHLFRDIDPLPQGAMEWCSCLEEKGLPFENSSSPAFATVFDTCRDEVLRDGTVNVVDICHGMYNWFGTSVRQTFCAPLHTVSSLGRLDCSRTFVNNLMPEYCNQYRLEYSKYLRKDCIYDCDTFDEEVRGKLAKATLVVVDGMSIGLRQTMDSFRFNFKYPSNDVQYPKFSNRAVAEKACSMMYPDNPDACCSYARAPVLFGTCCRTEGSSQKFDCTHPDTYRGTELFYHCLQSNGRYDIGRYFNLDMDPTPSWMQASRSAKSDPSSRSFVPPSVSESFGSIGQVSRASYSEYHFPLQSCGNFIQAYLALEYGNLTLERRSDNDQISAVIPTNIMQYTCFYVDVYDYSIGDPCCYEGGNTGTFASSIGSFFAQCVATEPLPEVPTPEPEDSCHGVCPEGMNCFERNNASFCGDCEWFMKDGEGDEELTCCRFNENRNSCRAARISSERVKCRRDEEIYFYLEGKKTPANFMRDEGPICNNVWDLRRNGGACKVIKKSDGSYKCRYAKRFRS